jgi:hypothetical protein
MLLALIGSMAGASQAQGRLLIDVGAGLGVRNATAELLNACTPRTRIVGGMVGLSHPVRGRVGVQAAWHGQVTVDMGGDTCLAMVDAIIPVQDTYTRTRAVISDRAAPSALLSLRAAVDVVRAADGAQVRVFVGPAYAPERGTLLPSVGGELRAGRGAVQFRAAVDYWRGSTRFLDERVTTVPAVTITTIDRRARVESLWALQVGVGLRRR